MAKKEKIETKAEEKEGTIAILKKLTGKQQAIQDIIDNIEIEFKITKEGHRLADIKLKK